MSIRPAIQQYQQRGSVLVTAPTIEPVNLATMRTHLRLDDSDTREDTYIQQLISEARQEIEDAAGIALLQQTWRLTVDRWPGIREQWWEGTLEAHINILHGSYGWLVLPRYPLLSVDSVTVYDEDGTATSVTVSNVFDVDTEQQPGRLALKSGQTWPVALRPTNAIEIEYKAGYGTSANDVPLPLRRAIRNLVAHFYQHRGDCESNQAMSQSGADKLVSQYKALKV